MQLEFFSLEISSYIFSKRTKEWKEVGSGFDFVQLPLGQVYWRLCGILLRRDIFKFFFLFPLLSSEL